MNIDTKFLAKNFSLLPASGINNTPQQTVKASLLADWKEEREFEDIVFQHQLKQGKEFLASLSFDNSFWQKFNRQPEAGNLLSLEGDIAQANDYADDAFQSEEPSQMLPTSSESFSNLDEFQSILQKRFNKPDEKLKPKEIIRAAVEAELDFNEIKDILISRNLAANEDEAGNFINNEREKKIFIDLENIKEIRKLRRHIFKKAIKVGYGEMQGWKRIGKYPFKDKIVELIILKSGCLKENFDISLKINIYKSVNGFVTRELREINCENSIEVAEKRIKYDALLKEHKCQLKEYENAFQKYEEKRREDSFMEKYFPLVSPIFKFGFDVEKVIGIVFIDNYPDLQYISAERRVHGCLTLLKKINKKTTEEIMLEFEKQASAYQAKNNEEFEKLNASWEKNKEFVEEVCKIYKSKDTKRRHDFYAKKKQEKTPSQLSSSKPKKASRIECSFV